MKQYKLKNKLKHTGIAILALTMALPSFAQSVKQELQAKLAQLQPFSADFTQTVTSAEDKVLLTAQGNMQLQRPNQFRWHTVTPDEQLIVSNGETLWFYNPFVEQVSIYFTARRYRKYAVYADRGRQARIMGYLPGQ